jgi:hypothetical protein
MFNQYSSEEARLLRQLLTDAHTQIRELQAQVEQLSSALLMLNLSDRRRASEFHPDGSRERRRESAPTVAPERDRRGRGRQPSA